MTGADAPAEKEATVLLTCTEAAKQVGLSSRRLRQLLAQGRVRDARMIGGSWITPVPVEILPSPRGPGRTAKAAPDGPR